jgi:hypothetical protein
VNGPFDYHAKDVTEAAAKEELKTKNLNKLAN